MRGLAIERALARAGFSGTYSMLGPQQPFGAGRSATWNAIALSEAELRSETAAKESRIARAFEELRPDVLIVDMFWAPLRYILPLRGCEAWLLLRSFPPVWLRGPEGVSFAPDQYERVIAIEPVTARAITHTIDPVVIANPDECRPRGSLRKKLGVEDGETLSVVVHAGMPGEIAQIARIDADAKTLDLHADDAIFPVCEWLGDCDRIACGAGYNTFWEAHWLGYAPRTTFFPFARSIDDQRWRTTLCGTHPERNGADVIASWIVRGR